MPRSLSQVVGLLGRRIDCETRGPVNLSTTDFAVDVQKNINTIGVSLRNAEEKAATSLVLSQPDVRNEDGLPLAEIREELDEEGNVICTCRLMYMHLIQANDP